MPALEQRLRKCPQLRASAGGMGPARCMPSQFPPQLRALLGREPQDADFKLVLKQKQKQKQKHSFKQPRISPMGGMRPT